MVTCECEPTGSGQRPGDRLSRREPLRTGKTDVDARVDVGAMLVTTIFGGTTEIMKEIIGRNLGL